MRADRYLKLILTVIALELFWLGMRDALPTAFAQQKAEPTPVVITGVRIGRQEFTTLPVALTGSVQLNSLVAHRELPNLQPATVRLSEPIVIDSRQPVTVQTGTKPLVVDAVKKTGPPGN